MRFCAAQIVLLLVFALLFPTTVMPTQPASSMRVLPKTSASIENTEGLTTAIFDTKAGRIRFNLPDDMIAGDTLTGTVYAQPSGNTEKDKAKNLDQLNSHSIDVAGQVSSVANRYFRFDLPITGSGVKFQVALKDKKGKRVSSVDVPLSNASLVMESGNYRIPDGGQTGRWIKILGSFDGDLQNTQLAVGGTDANPLAESPRQSVFQSPVNVIGPTEVRFKEGNTSVTRVFRNIDVRLSAAKRNLQRGETTQVSLNVSGLQGIEDDVPLHLTCTGSADMQGGNIQNMQIDPSEVNSEGQFLQTRTLVGNHIGNFNVTATVLFNAGPVVLNNNLVHVERLAQNKWGDYWGVLVKTLDGKTKWVLFPNQPPPIIKPCQWITITESEVEDDGDVIVKGFTPTDDPTQPCVLENKTVHIEGSPQSLGNGRWWIKIKLPNGDDASIIVKAPTKPDLKLCNWIKVSGCKKLPRNTFEVGGYDVTEDPNKPPPPAPSTPTPTPTPIPTPTPSKPPAPVIKPCTEGATRPLESVSKEFKILSKGSQLSFSIKMNNGGGQAAAEGMAAWLGGVAELGSILTGQFIPDDQALGGGVADAALKYVELGGDIIGALAKSNLGNSRVSEVSGTLSTKLIKVTAVCRTYEICENGIWKEKKAYSEEREIVDYSDTVSLSATAAGYDHWQHVTDPSTRAFDVDRAEEYLMKLLLEKLKKNEVAYGKFKENCK